MNDTAQIITATGTAIAAVLAALFAGVAVIISARNARISRANSTAIQEVHKVANALSERAASQAKETGRLEGELRGRDHTLAVVGLAAALDHHPPNGPTGGTVP